MKYKSYKSLKRENTHLKNKLKSEVKRANEVIEDLIEKWEWEEWRANYLWEKLRLTFKGEEE